MKQNQMEKNEMNGTKFSEMFRLIYQPNGHMTLTSCCVTRRASDVILQNWSPTAWTMGYKGKSDSVARYLYYDYSDMYNTQ